VTTPPRRRPGAFRSRARSGSWIDGVDVASRDHDAGAVVALGDSVTAGFDSTENANVDWLGLLANRLRAAHTSPPLSVLNAGISGNNLHESSPCFGQSGLAKDAARRVRATRGP
jgi:lysophospholipase L1-like esterase